MTANRRLETVRTDIAAFADDDEEVILDENGLCMFVRGGQELSFKVFTDADDRLLVDYQDSQQTYRAFLTHTLARLDVLAERILAKRPPLSAFVTSQAELHAPSEDTRQGSAIDLLAIECDAQAAFVSRVLFLTADAGQGKTALLRQFQHDQARRFIDGAGRFVFWHVDLQGRQLLRLSEALMGDLGDLRVPGLWMPAVIRLLRHRALILAIDGFDELAAEQGSSDALGALALLVQQMGDQGTIVAASRRTFFDTDDYLSRARLFARVEAGNSQFDQLTLREWGAVEGREYLKRIEIQGARFQDPGATYDGIVEAVGDPAHTMVSRPFLLAQIARALLRFNTEPADFIRGMDDPYKGVGAVIEAFVEREVAEKWKQKDTGEPFLDKDQHLRFLSDVAEEMFRSQRTSLDVDVVDTIATLLFDEWHTETSRRQQILDMVRMHVLLTPEEGDYRTRTFDHEEFLAWFTAYALKDRLLRLHDEGEAVSHDLLSLGQMSDATARYACALVERTPDRVRDIITGLESLVAAEWRPTHLQVNAGTLIPYLLNGIDFEDPITVAAPVIYSSVVFSDSKLRGIRITNGSFVNVSLDGVDWMNVILSDCDLGEITVGRGGRYTDVSLVDCTVEGVRIATEEGDERREYAPDRIGVVLRQLGISVKNAADTTTADTPPVLLPDNDARKLVRRVLNVFRRTTFLSEQTVVYRFPQDSKRVLDEVLPLMEQYGIVQHKQWRGSGKGKGWGPTGSVERIERADGQADSTLSEFWERVDALHVR